MKRTKFVSTIQKEPVFQAFLFSRFLFSEFLAVGGGANAIRVNNSKRLSFSEKMMLFRGKG
ncbi:TPA: hypothetical protein U1B50_000166 [Streptococcus suis]|nr:hypothetical protein [Streptococcus suis]HEM3545632.1 hypothetical protein [Streptococcus suis]